MNDVQCRRIIKFQFVAAVPMDYSLVYYNVVLVYVCKNVKYVVDSASIVVDLRVLVNQKERGMMKVVVFDFIGCIMLLVCLGNE